MTLYPTKLGRLVGFSSTQEQAAHKIAERLSMMLKTYVDPYDLKLYPARGFWTHRHQDVQKFTGCFPRIDLPKLTYSIGAWTITLSEIAKGTLFDIRDCRGSRFSDANFEIDKVIVK
jgi:hypothetical protein